MKNEKEFPKFHSIKSISNIFSNFLVLAIALSGISMISSAMEINLLESSNEWSYFTDELEANDLRVFTIDSIYLIISLSSLILFFIWFYKAYKNLPSLGGRELRFSARWVIIRFFIPVLGFYQPYQATREIWKASDPAIQETDKASRKQMNTPSLIKSWWALWIITSMIGSFISKAMSAMVSVGTIDGLIALSYMYNFIEIPTIISSVLTLFLVRKISFNQEKKGQSPHFD